MDRSVKRVTRTRGSVTVRLLAVAVPLVLLAVAGTSLMALRASQMTVERLAQGYGQTLATQQASAIEAMTRVKVTVVEGMARAVEAMVAADRSDRRVVAEYVRRTALAHPNLVGFWFLAEPDFMGRDQDFRNGDPTLGLPGSGRFAAYYVTVDGQLRPGDVQADFDRQPYYRLPADRHNFQASPPYLRTVLGRPFWVISYAIPVYVHGRLIGVAGTDLSLDQRAAELDAHRPLGGDIYMLNKEGDWTYHPDHALLATRATVGDGPQFQITRAEWDNALKVRGYAVERRDAAGRAIRRYAVPLSWAPGDLRRLLVLDVPLRDLRAPFAGIGTAILVTAGLAALLLSLVLVATVRVVLGRPLSRVQVAIERLDAGDLATVVPDTGRPEQIGDIARALDRFRQTVAERDRLRAQVEERTTELERMLGGVAAAKDAIVLFDQDYRVLFLNPAAVELLRAPDAGLVVGRLWPDCLTPESDALANVGRKRRRADLDATGYSHSVGENWTSVWGGHMDAFERMLSLRPNGDIVMVLRDISATRRVAREREALQRQLLLQDKMEAIGRLAGGVANDFNALLGAMLGYVEFLLNDLDPQSRAHSYVARIAAVGKQAKELVGRILVFARTDEEEVRSISPAAVVDEARGILRSAVPATTDLIFQVAPSVPNVRANPAQLLHVLMNLVVAAHDNAQGGRQGAGGRITVRLGVGPAPVDPRLAEGRWVGYEALPFDTARPHVVIEVEDNGPGIAPEIMPRLFEPSFAAIGAGRGGDLAMPVVYGVVKSHGGGLAVMTGAGEGTLLRILLPVGGPVSGPADSAAGKKLGASVA